MEIYLKIIQEIQNSSEEEYVEKCLHAIKYLPIRFESFTLLSKYYYDKGEREMAYSFHKLAKQYMTDNSLLSENFYVDL